MVGTAATWPARRAVRRRWWRRSGKAWCGREGSREERSSEERRGGREWRRRAKGSGGGGEGRREARRLRGARGGERRRWVRRRVLSCGRKREREDGAGAGEEERCERRAVTKARSSPASGGRVKCGSGSGRGAGIGGVVGSLRSDQMLLRRSAVGVELFRKLQPALSRRSE
jgi:hypothetical protein